MTLGSGVGSAVMGATGIVGQAAFIPVASALPFVAPILAIQALNTAVMMQQFKQVDRKLDAIKGTLDRTVARIEATHAGELLAASRIVDDVYAQYGVEGSFSNDMLVRLALAERDTRALASRFRQLVQSRDMVAAADLEEVQQANYDAHSAMLSSFIELRIAYLRVCVDMQENPKSVTASLGHLKATIDDGIEYWQRLQNRSDALKVRIHEIEEKLAEMKWAERNLPGGEAATLEKKLAKYRASYTATMESEKEITVHFQSLIESARTTRAELDAPASGNGGASPTLVYWKDELGEHSFVTQKQLIGA
ncbi:hypothetical protein ACX9R5_18650 [Rathayibacter sp. CAU 1779]